MKKALLVALGISLAGCGYMTDREARKAIENTAVYRNQKFTLEHVRKSSKGTYICGTVTDDRFGNEQIFVIGHGGQPSFTQMPKAQGGIASFFSDNSNGKPRHYASSCDVAELEDVDLKY